MMFLVGFCVSRFAKLSACAGIAFYSYTADTLPPVFGVAATWGLLLAYLATGASVSRRSSLLRDRALPAVSPWGAAGHSYAGGGLSGGGLHCLARRQGRPKSCCGLKPFPSASS